MSKIDLLSSQRLKAVEERWWVSGNWIRDFNRDVWIAPNGRRFTSQQIVKARESPAAFVAMLRDAQGESEPEPKPESPKRRLYTKD